MAGLVYKSSAVEALDEFFSGDADKLRAAFDYSVDILDHWLGGPLAGKDVDRVMRHAYRQAIRLASAADQPLPIETFWVTGMGDDFEMQICEGPRKVTVFVFIPGTDGSSENTDARTFIVRSGSVHDPGAETLDDRDPPVVQLQASGPRT
jgi:hypothetical protein